MKKSIFIFGAIIVAAIFFYPQATIGKLTGSPGGKTGSPTDNTDCTQCHLGTTPSTTSNITSNIPSSGYVSGNIYNITAVSNTGSVGPDPNGFEVTCEENTSNTKTGAFLITNPNTTQFVNNGSAVTHTAAGNSLNTWSFDWEAPVAGTGDITFYGAFIEAGYPMGSNNGDYFSSTTLSASEFIPPPLTYVPDVNFENYLEANGMGDGVANNDSVFTSAIDTVTSLSVPMQNIADLTGIEDFTALTELICEDNQLSSLDISGNTALTHLKSRYNQLTSLDISNNTALTYLECDYNYLTSLDLSNNTILTSLSCAANQLTSLDVSNNITLIELDCFQNQLTNLDVSNNTNLTALSTRENLLTALDVSQNLNLIGLGCDDNQLTSLDVTNNTTLEALECFYNQLTNLDLSNNTSLEELYCFDNQITSLDLSNNTTLTLLECDDNQLTSLDLRNGNNTNITTLSSTNNPNLLCIDVDDVAWSTANWLDIDPQHYFSNNCSATSIQEHTTNKELLKATGLLGRKTKETNQPLFYIYDDGTVEKRIVIE